MLKVGIIGAGHFGRFHCLKAKSCPRETLIGLYDPDKKRAKTVAQEVGCTFTDSLEELIGVVDAAVIATPAEFHHEVAVACLSAKRHVLVEKPIASNLEEARALAALAQATKCVLQVGHLLRYSAEHRAISERIGKPLYLEATRIAPFKPRGTDVSVILDLMIHDLDLVMSLVDSPIKTIHAAGVAVSSAHEDIANARVQFDNGCVAALSASRISMKTERRLRVFSEEGYLSADFSKQELTMIGRKQGLPLLGSGGFRRENLKWRESDSLAAEHEAFVASCLDGAPIIVDAQAGIRALDAALRVKASLDETRARMEQSGLIQALS